MSYGTFSDPYCYPGTGVLKNIPGIRDQRRLEAFETMMTALRAEEPFPPGRHSLRHYRAISSASAAGRLFLGGPVPVGSHQQGREHVLLSRAHR